MCGAGGGGQQLQCNSCGAAAAPGPPADGQARGQCNLVKPAWFFTLQCSAAVTIATQFLLVTESTHATWTRPRVRGRKLVVKANTARVNRVERLSSD